MRRWVLGIACLVAALGSCQAAATEHVYHEGDLRLTGSHKMVIEDVVYHISGDIYLDGNAQLTFRNAALVFSGIHPDIWANMAVIRIRGSARLKLEDCSLQATGSESLQPYVFLYVHDQAEVSLDGVTGDWSVVHLFQEGGLRATASRLFEIRLFDSSFAEVESTTLVWAMGIDYSGNAQVNLTGLQPGYIHEWSAPATADGASPRLVISQSTIGAWSIGAHDATSLRIVDSSVDRLHIAFRNPSGPVHNLDRGQFENWSLQRDGGHEGPLEVVLQNTQITGHVNISIYDGSGPFLVANSSIADVWISNYTGQLGLTGCDVSAFQIWNCSVALELSGSTLSRGLDASNSSFYITGDCDVSSDAVVREWVESGCLRKFVIRVQTPDGTPVTSASGRVSGEGKMWEFQTDETGVATIWLSFTDANVRQQVRVSVSGPGGQHAEGFLSLLSTTPVVLVLDAQ